jgi:hypothetical protein
MKKIATLALLPVFIFFVTGLHAQDSATAKPVVAKDTAESKSFTQDLKTVTVIAVKPFIVQKSDRLILNVAESPVAAGGNAYDVLLQVPGITDMGGALQIGGKPVTVLIDGRYTNLSGEELRNMLAAMPANGIDRIELLAQPPAKYEARGGAVVNIITTKSRKFGTNGTVTTGANVGCYAGYIGGISLNFRNNKINAWGGYDYQYNQRYSKKQSDRIVGANDHIVENVDEVYTRNNHSFKGGLDYAINAKNSIGLLVKGMCNLRNRDAATSSLHNQGGIVDDSISNVVAVGRARVFIPSVNLWYRLVIDSTGKELSVQADYFSYNKKWNEDFTNSIMNAYKETFGTPSLLRNYSPGKNMVRSLQVDYVHPVHGARIETGLKSTFTTTDNDIAWEQWQTANWKIDSTKTNHFIYREQINAAYVNVSKSIKKFDIQAGLRTEQTNTWGYSVTLDQTDKKSYFNWFPNVSVMYNQSAKQQFGFSYRKSIQRFNFDVVNPFILYKSRYSWYQGNPAIRPSISHTFRLSHTYNDRWFTSLSYSRYLHTLAEVYKTTGITGAVVNTSENLGSGDYIDGSVTLSKPLFNNKWLTTNTIGAFYVTYHSPVPEYNNSAATAYLSSENMLLLGKGFRGEIQVSYYSPAIIGVVSYRSNWSANIGMSKTVLQNKATIACNLSDVFNTMAYRYSVQAPGLQTIEKSKAESRIVKLVFTYRFGNQSVKKAASRSTGIEAERRRMGE